MNEMNKLIKYIAMAMLVLGVIAGCRPNAAPSLKVVPSMDRTEQKSHGLGPATVVSGAPRLSSTRVFTLGTTLPQMRGTNLTGSEMDWGTSNTANPVSGTDYLFVSHQDIDYLASRGVNFARLLFSWEGVQPTPNAPFPTTGNNGIYVNTLIDRVNYATSKGLIVMVEPHGASDKNFARYKGNLVGSAAVPNSQFADLWTRMAAQFKGNPNVVFGLSNEPNNMSTVQWFNAAQAAVLGIRSTGAVNLIMVEGNGWSGAESWTSSWYDTATPQVSNATAWKIIQDPLNNTVAEVHSYFDVNAGGGANDVVSATIGVERLKVTVDWAKANGVKVFLGEFGTTPTATNAQAAVTNMLAYLDQNKDVVAGWSWWAYGPPAWWGGYQFTLDPTSNYTVDQPQMAWLKPYFVTASPPIADAGAPDAGPGPAPSPSTPTNPIAFTKGVVFTTSSGTTNWVYVPTTYDSSHATPTSVLVWLHGCGGQNQFDVSMVSPGGSQSWISLAPGGAENACWNVGTDSAKVLAALADLKTHFNVDPRRVVLGGYSSGGDLTYRTAFYNAKLFSGVIVENSSPFRDTGSTQAQSLAAAAWKFNVAHLAHLQDTTYAIAGVRTETDALTAAGFPMTRIEKPGTHYDSGATYDTPGSTPGDLRAYLLPYMNAGWLTPGTTPPPPPPPVDAGVDAGPPPPPPCVFTYSAWGPCQSTGIQTRTATSSPAGCVGTPVLSQTCTFVPPTTDTDGDGIVDALDKCPTVKGVATTATSTNGCPALVVTAVKTYDWGTGYCKQFYFKNVNPMPMPWKSMTIYLNDGKLRGSTSVWGGSFPNPTATGKVVVTPAGNSPVAAGTNMQAVGFCADYGPTKYVGTNGGISY
jgi:endoglucanase